MQTNYTLTQPVGLVGQLADIDPSVRAVARSYVKRRHQIAVALGGTDNGTYSIRVTAPTGVVPPASPVTGSYAATAASADTIVDELADALNAEVETINNVNRPALRNLARATSDTDADEVLIQAVRAGEVFTVDFPSNPNTNLTQTTVVDATPVTIPYGIAVAFDGDDAARILADGDTEAAVAGVLKRGKQIEAPDDGSAEFHEEGATLEIVTHGRIFVMPEDDVVAGGDVYARVAGTGQAGAFRGTPTGDTQVATITPAANMTVYGIEYGYMGATYSAQYAPTDGTTSVADACAGLEDAAADGAPTGVTVSAGGTTAITLTAAAGTVFDFVRNTAWNADTEAASTSVSVADPDAEAVQLTKCRWERSGGPTSGEPAILAVNIA